VSGTEATYEYDPVSNVWAIKSVMPANLYRPVAVSIGDRIFVTDTGRIFEYDPGADTWIPRSTNSGLGGTYSVGASVGTKIFSSSYDQTWEYDTSRELYLHLRN